MLLIYSPLGDYTIPPLGIAKLVGFMRNHDKIMHVLDYNIDAFYNLLSKENLHKSYQKICKKIDAIEEKYQELSLKMHKEYSILFSSKLQGEFLERNIEEALDLLKQKRCYENWKIYSEKATIIKQSMELVANAYFPSKWDFRYLVFRGDTSLNGISSILDNKKENFYLEYFENKLVDFEKYSDKYFGISVCYYSQLIPALTLAKLLKSKYPKKKVFLGGSLFASYINQWHLFDEFATIIDYIIPFAGEWSLLDLEMYLNPEVLLPIEASTECYWGKCNFCYYSTKEKKSIKCNKKGISEIVDEMYYMNKEYGATSFFFIDECLPPATAFGIANKIIERNLKIHWSSEIRFDSAFTEEKLRLLNLSGYIMAMLGLESSQERVLKAMNKGTNVQTIKKMLKFCSDTGIHTYAMFFLGFPSETKEEALRTVEFIDKNMQYINYYSFGPFILTKNIDIFQNPQEYGVTIRSEEDDLSLSVHYDVNSGLSEFETSALVQQIKQERDEFMKYELISVMHVMYLDKISLLLTNGGERDKYINKKSRYRKNPYVVCQESKFDILNNNKSKGNYNILYNCLTKDVFLVSKNFMRCYKLISQKQTLDEIDTDVLQKNMRIIQIMLENGLLIPLTKED